jgi:hypothetical protein
MERLKGYIIAGSNERPDFYVHRDVTGNLEIRRDVSAKGADEFRAQLTLEEAYQVSAALIELLPKRAEESERFP